MVIVYIFRSFHSSLSLPLLFVFHVSSLLFSLSVFINFRQQRAQMPAFTKETKRTWPCSKHNSFYVSPLHDLTFGIYSWVILFKYFGGCSSHYCRGWCNIMCVMWVYWVRQWVLRWDEKYKEMCGSFECRRLVVHWICLCEWMYQYSLIFITYLWYAQFSWFTI